MLRRFVRDILTYLPSKLLPAITGVITVPILTRLFLPDDYGNYALAAGLPTLLFALAGSGYGATVTRFYPAYKVKGRENVFFATVGASAMAVIFLVALATAVGLQVFRPWIPEDLYPLLLIAVLIFVFDSLFLLLMSVVRSQERSGVYTTLELASRYGSLGLGLLLVMGVRLGVEGLLLGELIAIVLCLPLLLRLAAVGLRFSRSDFRKDDAAQVWRYAWPLAVGNMAMWALRLSDRYIIGAFRPMTEVGLYSVSYTISDRSIDMLVALFLLTRGPMLMNLWESQGREAAERLQTIVTRLFLIVCLPAATGLTLLAYPLVALLTGDAYHDGYRVVGFVAFASFCWGMAQLASTGLLIGKRSSTIARHQIAMGGLNLGLNLLLVPFFGYVAAGATTLLSYAGLLALHALASRHHFTWRFPWPTAARVVAATIIMSLVTVATYGLAGGGLTHLSLRHLAASVGLAVPVYALTLLALGEATTEERAAAKQILRRLTGGVSVPNSR